MWGESNHALLDGAVLMRVLPARAPGWMISLESYPGVVEGEGTIIGEYLEFDDLEGLLPRLDEFEGPDYCRRRVQVEVDGEGAKGAWIYHWRGTLQDGPRIESGDWRAHRRT